MQVDIIKTDLHQIIDQIEDAPLLQAVYEILTRQDTDQTVVGYASNGIPITKAQYIQEIEEARTRVAAGNYTTQEDLEKEMEQW